MNTIYTVNNNIVTHVKHVKKLNDYKLKDNEIVGSLDCSVGCDINTKKRPPMSFLQQQELRKNDLRTCISDKKLLDMDCTAEQEELKQLLGL